jgi:hypothetical protein
MRDTSFAASNIDHSDFAMSLCSASTRLEIILDVADRKTKVRFCSNVPTLISYDYVLASSSCQCCIEGNELVIQGKFPISIIMRHSVLTHA